MITSSPAYNNFILCTPRSSAANFLLVPLAASDCLVTIYKILYETMLAMTLLNCMPITLIFCSLILVFI